MRGHPAGNDGRDALEADQRQGEDVAGGLVGSQAMERFDLANNEPIEASEVPFQEPALDLDRLAEPFANNGGRRNRSDQRAHHNPVNRNLGEALRRRMRLSNFGAVKRGVGMP
jgi:hypothetical protein